MAYRGVFAMVHNGYVICGGYNSNVHSMHAVTPGKITRALPLKPSVPPSMIGINDDWSRLPSSS